MPWSNLPEKYTDSGRREGHETAIEVEVRS